MLEFHVLGPLEVADHGRPAPLGSGRQVRLLSCLLLHSNEVVPRDLLIDALWGERAPKTADTALRVQVHTLRKLLGQERIDTDGPGYRLHVGPGELDLERFEELFARGRNELASGAADEAATTFRSALALWRGPALADVAYEAFAQSEIARLEAMRLAALEERVEADLALGRHRELVPELEALVSEHPAARAPARPADARPVPQRPPDRGPRRLPPAAQGARRGAGARAGSRSQGARAGDAPAGRGVAGGARRAPRAPPSPGRTDPACRSPARARRDRRPPARWHPSRHADRAGRDRQDTARAAGRACARGRLRRRRLLRRPRAASRSRARRAGNRTSGRSGGTDAGAPHPLAARPSPA